MTKVILIVAGSVVFTRNLLTDILSFAGLYGATIALHDIDPERLETAGMVDELKEAHGDAMPEGIRTSGAGAGRSHYTPHS